MIWIAYSLVVPEKTRCANNSMPFLSNIHSSAKWSYIGCMIFFAFLMAYMLFASAWLTYVGVSNALSADQGQGVSRAITLITNGPFRDIIISFASTYIMYFIASFLFFDPWHMFTSFIPYLFMMPSYTNVLNIYAFCNTHDVRFVHFSLIHLPSIF